MPKPTIKRPKTANTILSRPKKVGSIERFKRHLAAAGYSPLTLKGYTADLLVFAAWFEGGRGEAFSSTALTPTDIRDYKSYQMTVKNAKPATVNRRLIAVSRFCSWAKSAKLMDHNPTEDVKLLEREKLAPRSLSRAEQNALVRAVEKSDNGRDAAIVHLLVGAGLRLSELAALKRSDIDFSERKGWVHVRLAKGMKTRDIPLNRDVRQALEDYFASHDGKKDDPLLSGQRGPLQSYGVWEIVKKFAYQAKLEQCSPHTLRHTFGKNLVDAGVPLDQVAILLGHESLDTTKIYTQPTSADLEKAVERVSVNEE